VGELEALRLAGHLDTTGSDLLTISGVGRSELAHSAVVAWLLDPRASHGLGPAVLDAILEAGWGLDAASATNTVSVELEVARAETRADIVVDIGARTLIIENKVDAPEQETQCDDFYREWGPDLLYLILSPSGARPRSARRSESRTVWRALSYGALARLLADLLPAAQGPGRAALVDYLETLHQQFPPRAHFSIEREDAMSADHESRHEATADGSVTDPFDTPRLRFFLQHRGAIVDFRRLESEFNAAFAREVQGLLGAIEEALASVDPSVRGGLENWNRTGSPHPLCWRPGWTARDETPTVAVGLAWDRTDPGTHSGLYLGVFVAPTPLGERLRPALRESFRRAPIDGWVAGLYPVVYRYLPATPDWWTHVPGWRAGVMDEVVAAWRLLTPQVDDALRAVSVKPTDKGPAP
jgi:hypothetical protein